MKPLISVLAAVTAYLSFVSIAQSATHDVIIEFFSFNPPTLAIKTGDTVRWTNRDGIGHTVTRDITQEEICGFLFQNDTCMRTFNTVGTLNYHCSPHPAMTGTVTVEGEGGTVTITSPANGASFTGPANVTVRASASDLNGFITSVEFFDGANSLGSDSSAPYEVNPLFGLGQHILTAIATDNSGAQATSAPVTITITSPRVTNPIADRIPKGNIAIELEIVAEGLQSPVGFAVPDDNSGRMLVYDQAGLIWVLNNGVKESTPMLDVRNRLVLLGGYDERGLLGVAVHPDFAQFPFVYTFTSEPTNGPADFTFSGITTNHQSVIAEWEIDPANPLRIDPASRREILRIDKQQSNHNGGTMRFGPDGMLYISLGDGGQADDQGDGHVEGGNAQFLENIYGKLIRIDVNARTSANGQYGIPADNPFVGVAGIDEIYAYGLRNPFAFSFDRANGALYLADVGQNSIEELDIIVSGGNYGWRVKEGTFYFDPNGTQAGYVTTIPVVPEPPNLIDPIAQYDHDDGLAIVGGYVYRGTRIPALAGKYVTGDWGNFSVPSGRLFYLDTGNVFKEFILGRDDRALREWIRGFGEGPDGELYVCVGKSLGPVGNSGRVLKLVPLPAEVNITAAQQSGGNLNAQWSGGVGPYTLEKKEALTDASWNDLLTTANLSGSAPTEAGMGFFRVGALGNHAGIPLSVALSGAFERPPIATSASGFGTARIEGNQLYLDVRYSGLSSTANNAHIHGPANASVSGGILIDLGSLNGGTWGTTGTLSGVITLTPAQKALILDGKTYINVHSGNNPGGEIRGQLMPVLMQAHMTGLNERPTPHETPATGQSTMFLVGTQLTFNITYKDLLSTATVAHIHGPASSAGSAGVLIDLIPYHNGRTTNTFGSFSGTVNLTPNIYTQLVDRLTYVNVHSTNYPAGEIRGQIIPKPSAIPLTASLSGAAERPTPVTTPGTGFGSFRIDGHDLLFEVVYTNLSSDARAAHIHGPANSSVGTGVLIDLEPYVVGSFGRHGALAGLIRLTPSQKAMILSGLTYVNIHTVNNGGGEIRGQIAPVLMFADLKGNNEVPTVQTLASGQGTLLLIGNRLWMDVTYRNLTQNGTLAHIHAPSTAFGTGAVRVNLQPLNGGFFGTSGSLVGSVTLNPSGTQANHDIGNVIDGASYINVHSGAFGNGEIRGPVLR
jgi:glucose/arabinose dehydrogenase/plastocyanin